MHEGGETTQQQSTWDPNGEASPLSTNNGASGVHPAEHETVSAGDVTEVVPGFIKEFSRDASQEERDALAGEIRARRRQRDAIRVEQGELGEEKEKLAQELDALAVTIEGYNDASFLGKIKDYFEYKKTKAEIVEKTTALAEVDVAMDEKEEAIPQFSETKKMIDDFYSGEKKKWAEAGYTPEDIAKQFTEERLSALSVDEYALLMQRFPSEMLAHVTRQGIRDHASSIWHTAGLGEAANGFKDMLKDGRLHSSLGIALQEHSKEDALAKFLQLDRFSTREEAMEMLKQKFDWNLASSNAFADVASVHFSSEQVMNEMYGSERGNEIFITYPAAYVASQLRYGGKGTLADDNASAHNDKWVYTKEHEGMPIDSGIIFIPEGADVDTATGSLYEIGEEGSPSENRALVGAVEQFAALEDSREFIEEARSVLGKLTGHFADATRIPEAVRPKLEEIRTTLKEKFGVTDARAEEVILDYQFLGDLLYEKEGGVGVLVRNALARRGVLYEKAQSTVKSKAYWEKYFVDNPDKRPSKVVYYSDGDPSLALHNWRKKSGVVKKTNDQTFGFPEHNVKDSSSEANQMKDRFLALAQKIIDDRFPEHAVAGAAIEEVSPA